MSETTEQLDAIEARAKGLTDLCAEHLRQSIRHVQRTTAIRDFRATIRAALGDGDE